MTVGEIQVNLTANTTGLIAGITRAKQALSSFSRSIPNLTTALSSLQAGFKGMAIGAANAFRKLRNAGLLMVGGVTLGLGVAINAGKNFQDAVLRAAAIASRGGKSLTSDFASLAKGARKLGRDTLLTATDVAKGQQLLARAGFSTNQILSAMPGITDLAIAADERLEDATSHVVSALYQFQLQSKDSTKVADTFVAATNRTKSTVEGLGLALGYVGAFAHSAGMSLEETVATLAKIMNGGIEASRAGTGLRRALAKLLHPSKETRDTLEKLGVSAFDSSGNLRKLSDILTDLERAGTTPTEMLKIFGVEAGPVMSTLLAQGIGSLKTLTSELHNSGGEAHKVASIFRTSIEGRIADLKASFTELANVITSAFGKSLPDAIFSFRNFINAISAALEKNGKLKKIIEAIYAALSPLKTLYEDLKKKLLDWINSLNPEDIKAKLVKIRDSFTENWDKIKDSLGKAFKGILDLITGIGKAFIFLFNVFAQLPSFAKTLLSFLFLLRMLGGSAIIGGILALSKGILLLTAAIAKISIAKLISLLAMINPKMALAGVAAAGAGLFAYHNIKFNREMESGTATEALKHAKWSPSYWFNPEIRNTLKLLSKIEKSNSDKLKTQNQDLSQKLTELSNNLNSKDTQVTQIFSNIINQLNQMKNQQEATKEELERLNHSLHELSVIRTHRR